MTRMLKTISRAAVACACVLAVTACASGGQSSFDAATDIREQSLLEADRAFAERAQEIGIADAFVEFMDEDAKLLGAAADPVVGSEAIHEVMATLPADAEFAWSPREAVVASSGDMGVTWGTYELTTRGPNGEAIEQSGRYLTVWRRDENGRWRGVLDIGT